MKFSEKEDEMMSKFAKEGIIDPVFPKSRSKKKPSSLKYRYYIAHLKYVMINSVVEVLSLQDAETFNKGVLGSGTSEI